MVKPLLGVLENIGEHVERVVFHHAIAVVADGEGRRVEAGELVAEREQAPVLRRGGKFPADAALAVAVRQHDLVEAVLLVEFQAGLEIELFLLDRLQQLLHRLLFGEIGLFLEPGLGHQIHQARVAQLPLEPMAQLLVFLHVQQELGERAALDLLALRRLHRALIGGVAQQLAREFPLVADVAVRFAVLDAVERRLGDVDVLALDQLVHVAEEESEQQRADVASRRRPRRSSG